MKEITKKYSITLEGNDLDAKRAQKLTQGTELKLSRINDGEDTFEISVSAGDNALDLIDYCYSIGIAPFIDDGSIEVKSAVVDSVKVKQGKSRAKDKTTVYFDVTYTYEDAVEPYEGESGIFGFIPKYDCVLAMAIYSVVNGSKDYVMIQQYLNYFVADIPMTSEEQLGMFDGDFKEGVNYNFSCGVIFDSEFKHCKAKAKIYNFDDEEDVIEIELDENEKQSALTLVNHTRIFGGEEPYDCICE